MTLTMTLTNYDDDDDDDDDEAFMKISNCSCYLSFFSKPYGVTMEIKLFQQYLLVVIINV